jgi:flagellar motor switch protein FliN/FliY
MTFSTSPLVPGSATTGDGALQRVLARVEAAVAEAMPQVPSPEPLTALPAQEPSGAIQLPAGTALTAYLGAGVEGKVLLVVAQELVDALAGTPFGAVEPAQALRPAMDAVAAALGGRLDGAPTQIGVEDSLDVLAGGTAVVVPLLAGEAVHAVLGVSLVEAPPAPATAGTAARSWGIDMLRDVEMEVTCELGRTRMTVRQLLALAPGDVVELDRVAGSPADLLVNGTLLARGEVVVVDESFGLRITEIVTRDAT